MKRAIILIMDSFGIGATEDAGRFGDSGANTFGHIAEYCDRGLAGDSRGALALPNLSRLALLHASEESCGQFPAGLDRAIAIIGAYGPATQRAPGNVPPGGHRGRTAHPRCTGSG